MNLYRFLYSLGLCLVAVNATYAQQGRPARVGVYQPITGIEAKLAQERYWQEVARRAKELNFDASPEAALLNPTTWANDFIVIYAQPDLHVSDYSLAQRKIDEAGIAQALTELKTARNNKELAAATYNAIVERLAKKKLSPNIRNLFNKSIMQPVIESVRERVVSGRGERRDARLDRADKRRASKESLAKADAAAKAAEHAVKIAPIATESAEPLILEVAETATDVPDKYDIPELAIRQAGRTPLEQSEERNKALAEVRKEYEEGLSWFDSGRFDSPAAESAKKETAAASKESSDIPWLIALLNQRKTNQDVVIAKENAKLKGFTYEKANLLNAKLPGANLAGANLEGAQLEDVTLRYANLAGANLKGANLSQSKMPTSIYIYGNSALRNVNFTNADLTGANLTNANCYSAIFTGATLTNAIITGADFTQATITEKQTQSTRGGMVKTALPAAGQITFAQLPAHIQLKTLLLSKRHDDYMDSQNNLVVEGKVNEAAMKTIIDADLAKELINTPYINNAMQNASDIDDIVASGKIREKAQALQERYAKLSPFFKNAESASEDIETEAMSIQAAINRAVL